MPATFRKKWIIANPKSTIAMLGSACNVCRTAADLTGIQRLFVWPVYHQEDLGHFADLTKCNIDAFTQ